MCALVVAVADHRYHIYSLHGRPRQRDLRLEEQAFHHPQDFPRGKPKGP